MSWNTTDPDGVASSSIKIDNTTYAGNGPWADATSGVNFTRPLSGLSAGVHSYIITAVDKTGKSSQFSGSFTLTGSSPVVARNAMFSDLGSSDSSDSAKVDWLFN